MAKERGERLARSDVLTESDDTDPLTRISYQLIFLVALLLWMSHLLLRTPAWGWRDRLFPSLVGIPLVCLLVLKIGLNVRALRSGAAEEGTQPALSVRDRLTDWSTKSPELEPDTTLLLWIVLLPVTIYVLGMALAVPVFLFAFTWYYSRDLKRSALVTVVLSAILFLLFVLLLEIYPWGGILW